MKKLSEMCCNDISSRTSLIVYFCIASLYHHYSYLQENVPRNNPICSSSVMMDYSSQNDVSAMEKVASPPEQKSQMRFFVKKIRPETIRNMVLWTSDLFGGKRPGPIFSLTGHP